MNSITKPAGKCRIRILTMALALIVSALFLPVTAYAGGGSEDTTAPTVAAWLDGENLCVIAEDDVTVEAVFISGEKVEYPDEGNLILSAKEYTGEDNKITVYAADAAGNMSNTIVLELPAEQDSAIPAEPNPFTPSGTGTVVDSATDGDGKEFFTITTVEEHIFYLIIDHQRDQDNVYFLNAVTLQDLVALAEQPLEGTGGTSGTIPSTPTETPPSDEGDSETEPENQEPSESNPEKKSNTAMYLLIVVIALGGIVVGYYFKVLKPKRDGRDEDDDEDDEDEREVVENDKDFEQEPDEPEDADYADFKGASEMGDNHEDD